MDLPNSMSAVNSLVSLSSGNNSQVNNSNVNNINITASSIMKPKKPIVMGPTGKKRLSCSSCRKRRKKCDLGYPCGNCQRLNSECNINEEDLRKKRYTNAYVQSLESHIAYLETNLKEVLDKFYPNNSQVLNSMKIADVLSEFMGDETTELKDGTGLKTELDGKSINSDSKGNINSSMASSSLKISSSNANLDKVNTKSLNDGKNNNEKRKKNFVKGSLYPEGPLTYKARPSLSKLQTSTSSTSINSIGSTISANSNNDDKKSNSANGMESINEERINDLKTTVIKRPVANSSASYCINTDPMILESLSNFYKWLYPGHFIFVHRESFLYGFFNHAKNNYADSQYCSVELIHAMCAVGSRLSPQLQEMSEMFYEKSKSALLKLVFDEDSQGSITTVQALLCLAFYELGKGNSKLTWYFSGLAIRVGYDMGFQLDPSVWYTEDSNGQLTKSEREIRSRIYWGCYIADHFICLMLGRTSTLSVSNSTIPESDELPEVEGTEEFRFIGKHVLQISLPLKNLIILSRIVQIFTSKIFIESEDATTKIKFLDKFNSQVYNWRQSLPNFLQWSKELLQDEDVSTDPTISYFWYYYYIVRLTFNKPFIDECEESKTVVVDIIDDLVTLFNNFKNKFQNYQRATLYQLYVCLLAMTCLRKLKEFNSPTDEELTLWNEQLNFFSKIFYEELYPCFEFPGKLKEDIDQDIKEQEKSALLNQVGDLNYIHDFSLSNEIDDMIKEIFGIAYNPGQPLT